GASTPQRVDVAGGATQTVELEAVAAIAHLEIKTSEPTAILFLDDKALAEGKFSGDVAPGEHKLVVTKEGFERYETKLALSPHGSEKLDVVLKKPGGTITVAASENPHRG